MSGFEPAETVRLFFHEVLPGDAKKMKAESADAETGGGARGLRIPGARQFGELLKAFFPHPSEEEEGVREGAIHWVDSSEKIGWKRKKMWRPTDVRPNELRIDTIYEIEGWAIDDDAYDHAREAKERWFFVLTLDANGRVWARILMERDLGNERSEVREHIARRSAATREGHAVQGYVDLQTKDVYPQ